MISYNHDVWSVCIISSVTVEFVVFSFLNIASNLQPWRRVSVFPSLVCVCSCFLTTSVCSTVQAFMVLNKIGIIGCNSHHPIANGLKCVVLLELHHFIATPREYILTLSIVIIIKFAIDVLAFTILVPDLPWRNSFFCSLIVRGTYNWR